MGRHTQSIANKVTNRIYGKKRGWVFTPNHFSDLGDMKAVNTILLRLKRKGVIRHLARGLYDYPKKHPKLGLLSPSIDEIAHAIKGRDSIRLQPSGAYAANLLGLSEQVPMRAVFLTDGRSKTVHVNQSKTRTIQLKHTTPKNLATKAKISGLVIHALKYLGENQVDNMTVLHLIKTLSSEDKIALLSDIKHAPSWIGKIILQISKD